jgi:hypothetical protein
MYSVLNCHNVSNTPSFTWQAVSEYVFVSIPVWKLSPNTIPCRNVVVWKLWSCSCGTLSLTGGRVCSLQLNHSNFWVARNTLPYFTIVALEPQLMFGCVACGTFLWKVPTSPPSEIDNGQLRWGSMCSLGRWYIWRCCGWGYGSSRFEGVQLGSCVRRYLDWRGVLQVPSIARKSARCSYAACSDHVGIPNYGTWACLSLRSMWEVPFEGSHTIYSEIPPTWRDRYPYLYALTILWPSYNPRQKKWHIKVVAIFFINSLLAIRIT